MNSKRFSIILLGLLVFATIVLFSLSNKNTDLKLGSVFTHKLRNGDFDGFASTLTIKAMVQVKIKDNKIKRIKVNSFYSLPSARLAKEEIPVIVIRAQSTDIKLTPQAKKTSRVILLAIQDAVNRAIVD